MTCVACNNKEDLPEGTMICPKCIAKINEDNSAIGIFKESEKVSIWAKFRSFLLRKEGI